MTKKTTVAALAAALSACACASAADDGGAQPTNTVSTTLPTIVVEASRLDSSPMEMPTEVQVIGRREIESVGAHNLVEALEKLSPALHVSGLGGANPALKQISSRGYGENGFGRLLVLVDGERLNNADMTTPNLSQIDLGTISRIEVMPGPQTVLHGDQAVAGVVNVVTESEDYDTHGRISVRGGSWNTIATHASLRGGSEETRSRYWIGGGWDHSDGYRHRTGYDIWNASGGVRQDFEGGSFLRASFFYNDSDYELPGGLTRSQWHHHATQAGQYHDDFYRRTTYGMNVTGSGKINDENEIKVVGTASRRHAQSRTYGYWNVDYDMYSYELTPQWINTSDLFGLANKFILGTTYRYDRLHAKTYGPSKYELNRQTMAFFGQDTLHLTDEVALQAGVRYQRAWSENTQLAHTRRADDMFAYEGALLFTPVEDFKAYVKFSRFFRSPFLDEYASRSYVPDSMVSPEKGWSVDVGGDWRFCDGFLLAADAYVTKTKHEIMYDPWFMYNNVNYRGDTIREGVNARFGWERDKVAGIILGCSYVKAEFDGGDYDGKTVPLVPETTVSLNGRVWLWDECFVFGGYRYQSYMWSVSDFKNNGAYANDKSARIPAFGLFSVGAQYAPQADFLKGLKFGFTIENLFDRSYCDYATYGTSYYPGSGRCYMFTVSYEF